MFCATQIFDSVLDFFKNMGEFVTERMIEGMQPTDLLFYIAIGAFAIYTVITWVRTSYSYESRLIRAIDSFNMFFYANPEINEDNLVEFNNKMKLVPPAMRKEWQLYMLNRDKKPSEYLSLDNCVATPLKNTSYKNSVRTNGLIFNIFIALLFIISFAGIAFNSGDGELVIALYNAFVMPVLIYVLKTLLEMILSIRFNTSIADVYNNFHIFQRGLDKACATLPDYIDYEVLFSRKEIKDSIPILQDYIEGRELKEKAELEKAKLSEVEHEKYDFSAMGFDGSLLLERALKECEIFINNRKRLLLQIAQKNDELKSYKENYENISKDKIKQQQVSKENIERLRYSAESSTNRVEANAIKKQQKDEMDRQMQLEKDAQHAYDKYVAEKAIIESDVQKLEEELLEKKKYIEDAIMSEFKSYADKVYKNLEEIAGKNVEEEISKLNEDREKLSTELQTCMVNLDNKDKEILLKQKEIDDIDAELSKKTSSIEKITGEITQKAKELVDTRKIKKAKVEPEWDEYGGYYDAEGYYRYKNGSYYDPEGRYFDENGNLVGVEQKEEQKVKDVFEPVFDDHGGYFDQEGFYRYKNGSYYDPEGRYFDAKGNLIEKGDAEAESAHESEVKRTSKTDEDDDEGKKEVAKETVKKTAVKKTTTAKKPTAKKTAVKKTTTTKKTATKSTTAKKATPKTIKKTDNADLEALDKELEEESKKLAKAQKDLNSLI